MSGNSPIILLYHQVSPNKTTFIENYNINVEPNLFDNHMKILKEEYAPITFDEWNDAIKNNDDVSNRVLVTFDDGYKDVINYGAEILSKYDLDGLGLFIVYNIAFRLYLLGHLKIFTKRGI